MFTGDEYADGGNIILSALNKQKIKASFFLTGRFYRNPSFRQFILNARDYGHILAPHSDQHLLYCDWNNRDKLFVTKDSFNTDLLANINSMKEFDLNKNTVKYFIPPYEWHNDSITAWSKELGFQLINYTPGTKSTADYTTPLMKNYRSSEEIYQSILEKENKSGLSGYILLLHVGTDPARTDKFYNKLGGLIAFLKKRGYRFTSIEDLVR